MVTIEKLSLWLDRDKGLKSRFSDELNPPATEREDLASLETAQKIERGDKAQEWRLKHYPSIDVNHDKLFAGHIKGDLEDAEEILEELGYRNNPTAYVEVTDKYGSDEGSYARQIVTETGGDLRRPALFGTPTFFRRTKRQVHVCLFKVGDKVHFLAHEEKSAWLQPMRHVAVGDSSARIGVRKLRNDWYDHFNEELDGKDSVEWEVVN